MKSLRRLLIAAVVLVVASSPLAAQYDGAEPVPDDLAAGFNSITEETSRELLTVLAGPEFAGRGTGQEGFYKAAAWYADQLKAAGFQPGGQDGTWYQMVPLIREAVTPEHCGIAVDGADVVPGSAFGASSYTGRFDETLPVIFLKVGDEAPEITEDQFAGKLVIVKSGRRVRSGNPIVAVGRPACVLSAVSERRVSTESVSAVERATSTQPQGTILESAADTLAEACGVGGVFTDAEDSATVLRESDVTVHCRLAVDRESIDVPNVIGWFPGTDENVRNEYVAIGAHLDHLGTQRGTVYPGADDNGSGSTAILQICQAVTEGDVKPRRSVMAIVFCGEERGLLGSRYYTNHPTYPLEDMICMLNIDMIGRNEEKDDEPASENEQTMHLVGSKRISEELHDLVMEANEHVGFEFEYDEERVYTRSDHANFAAKGIPITFLFGGFSPYYHQPTDTIEGINFSKIANAARLNYLVLMMAAENGHLERNETSDEKAAAAGAEAR